jgi:hypothetical protein
MEVDNDVDLAQQADSEAAARDAANQLELDTGDAMDIIRDIDAQNTADELKTLMDSIDADSLEGDAEPQDDEITDPPQNAPAPADTQGKRPGIDQVLRDVTDNLSPEHAEVIRNLQSMGTRKAQETAELQTELKGVLLDVKQLQIQMQQQPTGEQTQADPEPTIMEQLKPDQIAILDAYAAERGLVSREELASEKRAVQANDDLKGSIEQGITDHGERFGAIDEAGQFNYGEEVKDAVQDIWSRVGFDDNGNPLGQGFTAEDLYKIADYDRLKGDQVLVPEVAEAEFPVEPTVDPRHEARRAMARKAAGSVIRNSGGGRGSANIYTKGTDSFESVIQKAAALAAREIFPKR